MKLIVTAILWFLTVGIGRSAIAGETPYNRLCRLVLETKNHAFGTLDRAIVREEFAKLFREFQAIRPAVMNANSDYSNALDFFQDQFRLELGLWRKAQELSSTQAVMRRQLVMETLAEMSFEANGDITSLHYNAHYLYMLLSSEWYITEASQKILLHYFSKDVLHTYWKTRIRGIGLLLPVLQKAERWAAARCIYSLARDIFPQDILTREFIYSGRHAQIGDYIDEAMRVLEENLYRVVQERPLHRVLSALDSPRRDVAGILFSSGRLNRFDVYKALLESIDNRWWGPEEGQLIFLMQLGFPLTRFEHYAFLRQVFADWVSTVSGMSAGASLIKDQLVGTSSPIDLEALAGRLRSTHNTLPWLADESAHCEKEMASAGSSHRALVNVMER